MMTTQAEYAKIVETRRQSMRVGFDSGFVLGYMRQPLTTDGLSSPDYVQGAKHGYSAGLEQRQVDKLAGMEMGFAELMEFLHGNPHSV